MSIDNLSSLNTVGSSSNFVLEYMNRSYSKKIGLGYYGKKISQIKLDKSEVTNLEAKIVKYSTFCLDKPEFFSLIFPAKYTFFGVKPLIFNLSFFRTLEAEATDICCPIIELIRAWKLLLFNSRDWLGNFSIILGYY